MTRRDSAKAAGAISVSAAKPLRAASRKRATPARSKPIAVPEANRNLVIDGKHRPKKVAQVEQAIIDPAELPDEYGLTAVGGCLAPTVPDGAVGVFCKDAPCRAGDTVVLWYRPEVVLPGALQASVKRLVLGIPPEVRFPWRDHPNSDVIPIVVVEQDHPPKRYGVRCAYLLAIHKFIGIAEPAEPGFTQLRSKGKEARNG